MTRGWIALLPPVTLNTMMNRIGIHANHWPSIYSLSPVFFRFPLQFPNWLHFPFKNEENKTIFQLCIGLPKFQFSILNFSMKCPANGNEFVERGPCIGFIFGALKASNKSRVRRGGKGNWRRRRVIRSAKEIIIIIVIIAGILLHIKAKNSGKSFFWKNRRKEIIFLDDSNGSGGNCRVLRVIIIQSRFDSVR